MIMLTDVLDQRDPTRIGDGTHTADRCRCRCHYSMTELNRKKLQCRKDQTSRFSNSTRQSC